MITNFNDIRDEFFSHPKAPYWSVYYGFDGVTKNRTGSNPSNGDMESSWKDLENELRRKAMNGDRFLVVQSEKYGGGNHANSYRYKIQIAQPETAKVAGIGRNNAEVAAIGAEVTQLRDQLWQERFERMEDKFSDMVDGLREENKELRKGNGINKFLHEKLGTITIPDLLAQVGNLMAIQKATGAEAANFIQKMPSVNNNATKVAEGQQASDDDDTPEGDDLHIGDMTDDGITAIQKLHETFGDKFETNLIKLADFARSNPALATQLLENLDNAQSDTNI